MPVLRWKCMVVVLSSLLSLLLFWISSSLPIFTSSDPSKPSLKPWRASDTAELKAEWHQNPSLDQLGVLSSWGPRGWSSLTCNSSPHFRKFSIPTAAGNMSVYLYNSSSEDNTTTAWTERGFYFEAKEKARFLTLSRDLPLIDVGAHLGFLTIPAAMQGRQVVAMEPVPENALRLCRSVVDFGHASLVHVVQNAVSSGEGRITLAMDIPKGRVRYEVVRSKGWGYEATEAYSVVLDRLLEVLPFKRAALKIDVESHEGHVLAGATRLFQEVDIPLVWLEWEHVKGKAQYGGPFILRFMEQHAMDPYDILSGQPLDTHRYMHWPFTVLWRRRQ